MAESNHEQNRSLRWMVAAALVAAMVLSACGDSDPGSAGATSESSTSASPVSAPTETTHTETTHTETTASSAPAGVASPTFGAVDPAVAGFDAALLDLVVDAAEAAESDCLMVVRDGQVVLERYWNDTDAASDTAVYSTTKSVTAFLVGIAADLGFLHLDEPASNFIDEWQGTDSEAVTIAELLRNTSGRYYDFTDDFVTLGASPDQTAYAVGVGQQSAPNTEWFYNNTAIQTLEAVLERATGQDMEAFANEHLFGPLGMDVAYERDPAGNPGAYTSLQAGCVDLARFGQLALDGGTWGDRQVVSADFVRQAVSGSTELNTVYGYLWWLNADTGWQHPDPRRDRTQRFWPNTPLDAFAALGAGNQVTMVLPTEGIVIVRLGSLEAAGARGPAGVLGDQLAGLALAALTAP